MTFGKQSNQEANTNQCLDYIPDDQLELAPLPNVAQPAANRGRRTSVSAESMNPAMLNEKFEKIVIPKSEEQKVRIQNSVKNNFLFRNLDEEQSVDVINAMAEKQVKAGENIIKQGAEGDFFYVLEQGTCDVFVSKNGQPAAKVFQYGPGGSFGELALMYNSPRAATITATTDCILWALDRVTFRRILMDSTSKKRRMYERFLDDVPLLAGLEPYERAKIADALETVQFEDGHVVIKQGDVGDAFYIIEKGEARVTQTDDKGVEQELPALKQGQYFGELALLMNKPRAATIIAKGKLRCVTLGKQAFDRLLGPAHEIIRRNVGAYKNLTRRKSIKELLEKLEKEGPVQASS